MTNYYRERDDEAQGIFIQNLTDDFENVLSDYIEELDPSEVVDGLSTLIGRLSRASGQNLIQRAIDHLEVLDSQA